MVIMRLLLFIILSLFLTPSSAQVFGGNPPSLKWKQLNTDTARVIYPKGLDKQAEQVAAIVHRLSRTTLSTIGPTQHKINIVLQNQTIIPNGYVGLAPFRSEFQLTPEQNSFDLGSLPWQKMLAIHEYRHVQQYNNFRVGLSGAFYYLFGEGGQAFANSLVVPNWFWEGDAVYQETLVSEQGRGRLPWFLNSYRSLWSGNKNYSWMKLRNGSLRDYVPDHYPLGYILVSYGRNKYGDDFWRKTARDAAAFHGLFYPLQSAVRRYSGVSFYQFRKDAMDFYGKSATKTVSPGDQYAAGHKHFAGDQEFPQYVDSSHILYMYSSYKRIPAFRIHGDQQDQDMKLRTRAISLDNYFSYKEGRVVYAAYETDPRWGWRDYSVLHVLDVKTGVDHKLTGKSRFFSPDISADGSQIVAVQEAADASCALMLIDGHDGHVIRRLPNPDSLFFTYPKYYTNDRVVSAVRNDKGQMSLALVNTENGVVHYLLPFGFQPIAFPSVQKDTIWFTASRQGKDQVYGLIPGGPLFRAAQGRETPVTGTYEFNAGPGGRTAWNTFTAVGYYMQWGGQPDLEPLSIGDWNQPLPEIASLERGPAHLLDSIETGHYPSKKYPQGSHLINFHSWRPYINDPDYTFSLVSDNVLNTLETQLFIDYNRNENYKQTGVTVDYAGLYPVFDAGWNYTFDRNALYNSTRKVDWNEEEAHAGLSIPLNWTSGRNYTSLQFGSDFVYNKRFYQGIYREIFDGRGFTYVDPYLSLVHQSQTAQQQIAPRMAQVLNLSYDRAVTTYTAHQFLASGFLYLPGVAYTHSLMIASAFQQRDDLENVRFSNSFPFSRGYSAENFYRMWRVSGNYQLPLLYPDWGFGDIVYFLRVRTNLFYDYTHANDFYTTGAAYNGQFRSFGSEVYFDTKWWNQLSVSFGIRYSHLLDPDFEGRSPNQWELILPLNLLSEGYSAGKAIYPTR